MDAAGLQSAQELMARRKEMNKRRQAADMAEGHAGTFVNNALSSFAKDKSDWGNFASNLVGSGIGGNLAEAMSVSLVAAAGQEAANGAAENAGAMADARNAWMRERVMSGAGDAARDMNLQNAARTAAMTDGAIADQSAYDTGMRSIGMSGIEGSANMERNLQYGMDRADAERQLEYSIMGNSAADFSRSLAGSFGDLSQNKADAMRDAFSGYMGQAAADNAAQWARTSQADYRLTQEETAARKEMAENAAGREGMSAGREETSGGTEAEPPAALETAEAARTETPGTAAKQRVNPETLFNAYSDPMLDTKSAAYLKESGLSPEDQADFDALMGAYHGRKDREGRKEATKDFLRKRGYWE
jgi:hypothetical protein